MTDQLMTLNERVARAAAGESIGRSDAPLVFVDGDDHERITWGELHNDAKAMAAALAERGLQPGEHVAILGPTTRALVTGIQAVWLAGGVLVMLPLPMRMGSLEVFVDQTRQRINNADCAMVLVDPQLEEFVQPAEGDPPFVLLTELDGDVADYVAPQISPDDLAVLQFTSGSTSHPKGVMLSHRAICNNIDGAIASAGLTEDDILVSWLPLYHDMGLIGFIAIPITAGIGLILGAPQDFMTKPVRWMQWISRYGGTVTAGPNFSWVLAGRSLRRADELDLSSMRVALSGAEPVDPDTVGAFVTEAARFGFDPGAVFPAFGMAELCIAGTFPEAGRGLVTDVIDQHVLEHEGYARPIDADAPNARGLALLGFPVPGLEIKIIDPTSGDELGPREVGELLITGNSLTSGYYNNPAATEELIRDGWLHTGDLAYVLDSGEMVMCGRIKDLIIIGGRNIYPQDVEKVVGEIDGVRAGNVVAFGQEGRNRKQYIVVVAETKATELDDLRHTIVHEVNEQVGVPPREVVLVPPGTIPKTSSGKLQRSACRAQFVSGELTASAAPR